MRKSLPRTVRKSVLHCGFFSVLAFLLLCVAAPAAMVEKWSVNLPTQPNPEGYPEGTFRIVAGQIFADGTGGVVVVYGCRQSDSQPVPPIWEATWLDANGETIFSYTAPDGQNPTVVGISGKNVLLALNDTNKTIVAMNRNGFVDSSPNLESVADGTFGGPNIFTDAANFFAFRFNPDRSQISVMKFRVNNQAP